MIKGRQLSNSRFQIDALDGLRGFAVLIVFLSHTSNKGIFLIPHLDFSGTGKIGVFLFFILSSFLLTYPFIKKQGDAFAAPFLLNYSLRRLFRVFPLYVAFLLVSLLSTALLYRIFALENPSGLPLTLTPQEFLNHILLVEGKSITWSIAVEFKYYFILPVLAYVYSVVLKNALIPGFLLTALLIAGVQVYIPQASSLSNDIRVVPYLPIFFIGAFLALCQHKWNESRIELGERYRYPLQMFGVVSLGAIAIMTPSLYEFLHETAVPYDFFHRNFIEYGVLWGVALFSIINGGGLVRSFFESRLLRYLGYISFSVYLLHTTVMRLCNDALGAYSDHLVYGWLVLIMTVLISHLSFSLIERPFSNIRYGRYRPDFGKALRDEA